MDIRYCPWLSFPATFFKLKPLAKRSYDDRVIRRFETENLELIELAKYVPGDSFFKSLDELGIDLDVSNNESSAQASLVTSVAVTSGILIQLLRAGSLLASFLSVIPLWRQFAPLLILSNDEKKRKVTRDDRGKTRCNDDAVETLFSQRASKGD